MSRGGARVRSGPAPDPSSGRSEKRKYLLTALPVDGYSGPVPKFPLPADGDVKRAAREKALWRDAWRSPQACAWSMPSESWRIHTIAMWVRTFVICESNEGTAADKSSLHRFADQIGLTTAGLAEMGWHIKPDLVAVKSSEVPEDSGAPVVRRLRG